MSLVATTWGIFCGGNLRTYGSMFWCSFGMTFRLIYTTYEAWQYHIFTNMLLRLHSNSHVMVARRGSLCCLLALQVWFIIWSYICKQRLYRVFSQRNVCVMKIAWSTLGSEKYDSLQYHLFTNTNFFNYCFTTVICNGCRLHSGFKKQQQM